MNQDRPPRMWNTEETADVTRLKAQTLRKLRSVGGGPVYVRLAANRVVYDPADVAAWLSERKRRNTADPGPGRAA